MSFEIHPHGNKLPVFIILFSRQFTRKLCFIVGYSESKFGSFARFACNKYFPVMKPYQFFDQRQANSGSRVFCFIIRLKKPLENLVQIIAGIPLPVSRIDISINCFSFSSEKSSSSMSKTSDKLTEIDPPASVNLNALDKIIENLFNFIRIERSKQLFFQRVESKFHLFFN
jgi:hypothetical protein